MLRLERKVRGRALRAAWSQSEATSSPTWTSTCRASSALPSLLVPLLVPCRPRDRHAARSRRRGHARAQARADLALLQPPAPRDAARRLLRRAVWLQGGSPRARRPLLERVEDENWFFDTELLYQPSAAGCDPRGTGSLGRRRRSRVQIVATAREDLRGIRRLRRAAKGAGARPRASADGAKTRTRCNSRCEV